MAVVARTVRKFAAGLFALILAVGCGTARSAAADPAQPAAGAAVEAQPSAVGEDVKASAAEQAESASGHGAKHPPHDPHDLTHANASPKLEDPSEWRYDMSLCTFAVFVVLLTLLGRFAWTPIMKGLENREKFIARQIEEARQSAEQAAAELKAYRDKMASAAQESLEIVNQARKDAEAVAEKVHQEAQQVATRERARAIAEIRAAKNAALREVARRGADLAVTLAGRIVRRELRTDDHAVLITEALEQFPSSN
jgi:F-type H+-transporting ATPase subunit b